MMNLYIKFHTFYRFFAQLITVRLLISCLFILCSANVLAQTSVQSDSIAIDTLVNNTDNALQSKVVYDSYDSIMFDIVAQKVYLYYNASIKYEDITLTADYIEIDWNSRTIYATGLMNDSSKTILGYPIFTQGEEKFTSTTVRYNFDSKRGKISQVITSQGEGVIHGDTIFKANDNEYFVKGGKYTTCSDTHPHFYIGTNKLKIIKNNKIITGPAFLVIEDIPTPLAIPFGFFPNKKGRSSGIVIPKYGESAQLGFFLREGGFYFGVNDNFDFLLTGDVYTLGSWGAATRTRYVNKYHYTGELGIEYRRQKVSDRELPDYQRTTDFFVRWAHRQDGKARANSSFSASVNAGTSTNFRNLVSPSEQFLNNTFNSSISYASWSKTNRWNFSAAARHSQNTLNRSVIISLPQLSLNMATWYPFQRKTQTGKQAWYEKINVGYTANALNTISTFDTLLFKEQSLNKLQYGVNHAIPVSASFRVFKYFNFTPNISYTQNWHFTTIRKQYIADTKSVNTDTVKEFRATHDYTAGASLATRIYGTALFRKGRIAGVRHTLAPAIGFSYRPDYSAPQYGYYKTYQKDSTGALEKYSIFQNGVYGSPASGKYGFISFGADNNIELKTRQYTDTAVNFNKVKLLESINISGGYNMSVTQFNWNPIRITARSTVAQVLNIYGGLTYDPYGTDTAGKRINRFEYNINKKLLRFTNADASAGITINNQFFKKKSTLANAPKINTDSLPYVPVQWNLTVNYNLSYFKQVKNDNITQTINFSGTLQLTPTWNINYQSGYDVTQKRFTYTTFGFRKDLHCWELSFDWNPSQQYYLFQINVKSSTLRDLKITKQRDRFN